MMQDSNPLLVFEDDVLPGPPTGRAGSSASARFAPALLGERRNLPRSASSQTSSAASRRIIHDRKRRSDFELA